MPPTANPFQRNLGAVRKELFVGRGNLLEEFRRASSRPRGGVSEVWAVVGDRGQGKTSIVHHLIDDAVPYHGASIGDRAVMALEWTGELTKSPRPLARHLYSRLKSLPWWERALDLGRRACESIAGGAVGPVPAPRIEFKPNDGHHFAARVRKRLPRHMDTLIVLLDEIGINEEAAERSLNFAREISNSSGSRDDLNIVVVLFIVRQQATGFLLRASAPRTPRRHELGDFDTADIQDLLDIGLRGHSTTVETGLSDTIHALTGGRPDVTMGLLLDAWEEIGDSDQLTRQHLEAAAQSGTEVLSRSRGALKEVLAVADADEKVRRVLLALSNLDATRCASLRLPADWLTAVRGLVGSNRQTDEAFERAWSELTRYQVVIGDSSGQWRFRGELLRTGLARFC